MALFSGAQAESLHQSKMSEQVTDISGNKPESPRKLSWGVEGTFNIKIVHGSTMQVIGIKMKRRGKRFQALNRYCRWDGLELICLLF